MNIQADLYVLAPELILAIGALALLLIGAVAGNKSAGTLTILSVILVAAASREPAAFAIAALRRWWQRGVPRAGPAAAHARTRLPWRWRPGRPDALRPGSLVLLCRPAYVQRLRLLLPA